MLPVLKKNIFFFSIILLTIIGFLGNDLFEWNRSLINLGEPWRIVTGSFCHSNLFHLVFNFLFFILVYFIYHDEFTHEQFISSSSVILSLGGFLLLFTDYEIYIGLSAMIYGLVAYFSFFTLLTNHKSPSTFIFLGVLANLIFQSLYGESETMSKLIEAKVATEAHLIYFIIGALVALVEKHSNKTLNQGESL